MTNLKRLVVTKRMLQIASGAAMKRDAVAAMRGKSVNDIAASIKVSKDPFLSTPEWKALRKRAIQEYGAKCMKCKCIPTNIKKINVDHIKPRKYFPHLAMDFNNLQVLCASCNKDKGNRHQTDYRNL